MKKSIAIINGSPSNSGRMMDLDALIERIARRYPSRWTQGYIRGKIRNDPAYQITLEALQGSPLPVLDIGCGMGFLSFYLREFGFTPPILGLDCDEAKIISAQGTAEEHYTNLEFRVQDAASLHDFRGNVVILDVLQYLTFEQQTALLQQIATLIPPGGQCLIRGTPRDASWRFQLTQWMDKLAYKIRWMKSNTVHYLSVEETTAPFLAANFSCEVRPLWAKTPFNSYLFVFKNQANLT